MLWGGRITRPLPLGERACDPAAAEEGQPSAGIRLLVTPHRRMDGLPGQWFDVAVRHVLAAGVFPRGDMAESLVVAPRLAGVLVFLAKVAAARLCARQGIAGQQLRELHEV